MPSVLSCGTTYEQVEGDKWQLVLHPEDAEDYVAAFQRAGAELLSLPTSPAHSDDDVRDVVAALHRVHARLAG